MANVVINSLSSKLDELFILGLILSIPTIPFFRYTVGGFEIPLAVPMTAIYSVLKLVSMLCEDSPIDLEPGISGILVAFLIWSMASVLWSSSLDPALRRLEALTWQLCFVLLTLNCCNLATRSLHRLGGLFMLMVLIPVVAGYYGFFTVTDPLHYQFSYEFPRSLGDRNSDTFMILTALPFALAMVLVGSFRLMWRACGLTAFLLMGTAVFFSLSRGNLLVMVCIVSILILTDFFIRKVRASSVVAMAVLCLSIVILFSVMPTAVVNRTFGRLEKRFDEVVQDNRWGLFFAAFEMAARHPLTGVGLNNFRAQFQTTESGRYTVKEGQSEPDAHNSFLGTWAELGLPGLILFTMVVFWPLIFLLRLLPRFEGATDPALNYLFLSAVGLTLVLVQGILAYDFCESFYFWVAYALNGLIVLRLDRSLRHPSYHHAM